MTIYDQYVVRCAGNSDIVGHLPTLNCKASVQGAVVLELGVRSGESTCAFLAAAEAHGGHVWSVDIDPPSVPAEWHDNDGWTFLQGDDMDPEIQARTPRKVDVLFIDTSHCYQHTLDELTVYGPRVRHGGVILLHDTDLENAPGSVATEDRGFPVRRAVQEWCRTQFLTPEFREGWHGLGVIEVI